MLSHTIHCGQIRSSPCRTKDYVWTNWVVLEDEFFMQLRKVGLRYLQVRKFVRGAMTAERVSTSSTSRPGFYPCRPSR
jgi:hypothetical protein